MKILVSHPEFSFSCKVIWINRRNPRQAYQDSLPENKRCSRRLLIRYSPAAQFKKIGLLSYFWILTKLTVNSLELTQALA